MKHDGQQGDVLLRKIERIPEGKRVPTKRLNVLAEGESHGHTHQVIFNPSVVGCQSEPHVFMIDDNMYVEAPADFIVNHETHAPQHFDAGEYQVNIVREYDYETNESRNVAD
jgi:hypothetical protein